MKNLVSNGWLKNNMEKENIVIFDVRNVLGNLNYGKEKYEKEHIPDAIYISLEEALTGEVEEHGGRHPLPDMREFSDYINGLGVDDNSSVIIYDDGALDMASRLWWMLKYIGVDDVRVLLGGFKGWITNNYPVTNVEPKIRKSKELSFNIKNNMFADIDDVKKAINNQNYVIIDSRSPERFMGVTEPIDKIAGHIPSTLNFPWTDLSKIDKIEKLKIKEHFKTIKNYNNIIVHCGSGITGAVNVLFMDEVELSPIFYIGGYSDWISYQENEIVNETD